MAKNRTLILSFCFLLICGEAWGWSLQHTWITGETITEANLNADWNNLNSEGIITANLANDAVTTDKILNGTITGSDWNSALTYTGSLTSSGTLTASGTLNASGTFQLSGTTITPSATELNYVDGVTSAIQTQLDDKVNYTLYTSSDTFTAPAGVTMVYITMIGGGGGGAGGINSDAAGGGGGSGAFISKGAVAVTPSTGYTVTIGAAGSAGATGANGGDGGDSSFIGDTVTITCDGGKAGTVAGAGGTGGAGGTAEAGTGSANSGATGGAGGLPITTAGATGGNGGATAATGGGGGAGSPFGVGGAGGNDTANGNVGIGYGTGGGGGGGNAATTGGAGKAGFVLVAY